MKAEYMIGNYRQEISLNLHFNCLAILSIASAILFCIVFVIIYKRERERERGQRKIEGKLLPARINIA